MLILHSARLAHLGPELLPVSQGGTEDPKGDGKVIGQIPSYLSNQLDLELTGLDMVPYLQGKGRAEMQPKREGEQR